MILVVKVWRRISHNKGKLLETVPEWRMEYNVTLKLSVYDKDEGNVLQLTLGGDWNCYGCRVVAVWVVCPWCGLLCPCKPHLEIWNGAVENMKHEINRDQEYTLLLTQTKHVNKVKCKSV